MMVLLNGIKSGGKNVSRSDLRVGTTLRTSLNTSDTFKVLQWNAGGMSPAKKTELTNILYNKAIDLFIIAEANVTAESLKFYNFQDFQMHLLPKSRQIASGILVGVRAKLINYFLQIKTMNDNDKMEAIKIEVWKENRHLQVYGVYNPPNNVPNLDILEATSRCLVVGDFNAHFEDVGYKDINGAGKQIKDYLSSNNLMLVYNPDDPPSYIHYNGTSTNPDLTLASPDIIHKTSRTIEEDPGSGHRVIITTVEVKNKAKKNPQRNVKCSWNFKKANWEAYKKELEEKLDPAIFAHELRTPDANSKLLCKTILQTAKRHVPKGKCLKYKPFWSNKLDNLKSERDEARKLAEKSKDTKDVITWRKKAAILKKEINISKRESYSKFLTHLDYRNGDRKIHKYISKMNNQNTNIKREPISVNGKQLYTDRNIAEAYNHFHTTADPIPKQLKKQEKHIHAKLKESWTQQDDELFNVNFTLQEVRKAILALKNGKSPGPDEIMAEFF